MRTLSSFYGVSQNSAFRETDLGSMRRSFAIELVPGHVCELNCECCYKKTAAVHRNRFTRNLIPVDTVKDYVLQAAAEGFRELVLIGGEPTLHPQIFDIIEFIRGHAQLTPILCTNGYKFADPKNVEKIAENRVTLVTHAYFPGGEEVIDKFSGKRGYAELLKRAIANIRKVPNVNLVMEMPLNDTMYPHALEFFIYCRESGITPFIEISRMSDDARETTSVTPEQVYALFQCMQEYDQKNFPHLTDSTITPPSYGNKCTMAITGLHVKNLGDGDFGRVYSCCAQGICHGDLRKESLQKILQSSTLAVFADQDRYIVGPCRDCEDYGLCRGGCRGQAFLKFGCPRASSPACHKIPLIVRNDSSVMAPDSCEGCPAQNCTSCGLKDLTSIVQ